MLSMNDTLEEAIMKLSEGNPGALTVLCQMVKSGPEGFVRMLDVDDMGMKGPAIWVGYKDWAGQDLQKFMKGVEDRDEEMVNAIRKEGYEAYSGGRS